MSAMTVRNPRPAVRNAAPAWRRAYNRAGYYYILPAVALFGLMEVYPILRSLYLSFFDYSLLDPDAARFAGLGNYFKLFSEQQNKDAFWHTLYFSAIFVPPYVLGTLAIAMMLNAIRRGSVVLRTLIFAPVVVSLAVSAVMWTLFYNANFGFAHQVLAGAINALNWLTTHVGLGNVLAVPAEGVLNSSSWAMIAIAVVCLWNGIGINVILYLVGLQRIPDELHEAAVVDGAGPAQRFWHVTLPQLAPTTFLVVLLSLIGAIRVFGQPYIMTQGGPADSTLTYVMRMYKLAFGYAGQLDIGYACSMAYALALFIFVLSAITRKLNRPLE
jgi:ABC-type sugar transport system permease subunit